MRASLPTSKSCSLIRVCLSSLSRSNSQIVAQEIMQIVLPFSLFPTVELGLGDAKLQNSTAHSRRFSAALSLGKQAASMAPPRPAGLSRWCGTTWELEREELPRARVRFSPQRRPSLRSAACSLALSLIYVPPLTLTHSDVCRSFPTPDATKRPKKEFASMIIQTSGFPCGVSFHLYRDWLKRRTMV